MQVNVIRAPDVDLAMSMSLGGWKDDNTIAYLQNNYNNFVNKFSNIRNDFVKQVTNIYNKFNDSNIVRRTKELLLTNDAVVNDEVIHRVNNIRRVGFTMRRYIMAEPTIYKMYRKERISGYDDEWFNETPEENNPYLREDYLDVVDGYLRFEEEDENTIIKVFDNPLSIRERMIVMETWDKVKMMIANDEDPTDIGE